MSDLIYVSFGNDIEIEQKIEGTMEIPDQTFGFLESYTVVAFASPSSPTGMDALLLKKDDARGNEIEEYVIAGVNSLR